MLKSDSFHDPYFHGLPFFEAGFASRGNEKGHIEAAATDAELVGFAGQGDERGFEMLVERYLSTVYKFAYRYMGNQDDASDVAQETFIKAWKHLKRFDSEKNFKTWILAIAKNTALDALKKKRPVLFSAIEDGEGDVDAFLAPYVVATDLPQVLAENKETALRVNLALETLPPSHRMIFNLRYGEHLKFKEIALIVDEPIDTVKSKHRRGLLALRKILPEAL